ncbi:MAG: hypothetical protein GTO13_17865, partial [Proteobacteria bacterium]|nr:hypothetical protein [Pseudomonadota bacterium]
MVTPCRAKVLRWGLPFVLAVVLTLIAPVGGAQAQDYSFTVDRNIVAVHVKRDGSIDIEYWITFSVDPGAPPIDVVDVGFPNEYYNSSSVTADIDGVPITTISRSPALRIGVRARLGPHAIPAGGTGTFHLAANNPHMVYPDTEDETYASMEFSPTWYGSRYTHGTTHLEVTIYFPPGVGPDETRYHRKKFTEARMEGDTPVMTWTNSRAQPDRQYMFGVSFPKRYVSRVFPAPRRVSREYGTGFPA